MFLQPLTRKYLRLSSQATVLHLKKFLAKKLSLEDHKDVSYVFHVSSKKIISSISLFLYTQEEMESFHMFKIVDFCKKKKKGS